MNITVWSNFSKRENSTKQPGGGQSINVKLKDNCSIENPIFLLVSGGGMPDYTYAAAFGHYYYVTDIISINASMAEIHCKQDVLATYKGEIGATRAFILYDTTSNSEIPDARLSTKTTASYAIQTGTLRTDLSEAGSFIVSLNGVKKVGSYVVPESFINLLVPDITTVFDQFIQGTDPFDAIRDSIKQLVGSGQISQNIRDVRWIPFTITGDQTTLLEIGMYDVVNENGVQVSGSKIVDRISKKTSSSIPIPWQFNDWRNSDTYTQISVYIPFVGLVTYPASALKGSDSIYLRTSLDKITGDFVVEVITNTAVTLGTYGASTAVSIPVGSSTVGGMNIVNSIMTGVAAIKNTSMAGLAGSILNAAQPLSQSVGGISSGAAAGLDHNVKVISICHDTVVSPSSVSSVMGTPAMATKTISSLSGYIQCQDASVNGSMRSKDRSEINGYLNSGFFYE